MPRETDGGIVVLKPGKFIESYQKFFVTIIIKAKRKQDKRQ